MLHISLNSIFSSENCLFVIFLSSFNAPSFPGAIGMFSLPLPIGRHTSLYRLNPSSFRRILGRMVASS